MGNISINLDYLEKLQEHPLFVAATPGQIIKGSSIAATVQEGDRPEEYLDEKDLYCLSAFYEYQAIDRQMRLLAEDDDEYPWPEEELEFQDD